MTPSLIANAIATENLAAAILRGLAVAPVSASELIASAQQTIGHYQQQLLLVDASELHSEDNSKALIGAARTLSSVAHSLQRLESIPNEEIRSLFILSACAYAMHGNFPSARAALNEKSVGHNFTNGEALAVSICNPALASVLYAKPDLPPPIRTFLEHFIAYIAGGLRPEIPLVSQLEQLMLAPASVAESVYLRCARLALVQLELLSLAHFSPAHRSLIFRGFIRRLIADGKFTLLPPQYNFLAETNLFSLAGNALLSLPTSSGKTLLAEFALITSLEGGPGISVYVVPYIALGNQIYSTLKKHCPREIDLVAAFGGYEGEVPTLAIGSRTIIVATPERFDLLLRKLDIFSSLRLVVVDEAHLIENGVRGARLEGLLGRLRLKQQQLPQLRIMLVSAVLQDVSALIEWLKIEDRYYSDGWRPTARRVAVWGQEGILYWLYGNDALRPESKGGLDLLGAKNLPLPQAMYPTREYKQVASQRPRYFSNVSYLARYLSRDIGDPILIVCMSKANTRGVAAAIARELPVKHDISPERDAAIAYISDHAQHLQPLAQMLKHGVAFHNSSLPPRLRGMIEAAIRVRAVTFVASTTTLAEGVDLPFRVSIVADWLLGFNDNERPISPLLFRNIAGRCGRAGEFSEGDTILFDNVLGGQQFTSNNLRQQWQAKLFGDPPALRSAAFDDRQSPDEQERSAYALASQFLACVPECPDEEDQAKVFSQSLYSNYTGSDKAAERLISKVKATLLNSEDGEPLAVAASPIRLTPFGIAANRTGLSPQSCRAIRAFLRTPLAASDFWGFCSHILLGLGTAPEQQNSFLYQMSLGKNPKRFFVTAQDVPALLKGYYSNAPLPALFASLPKAIKSKSQISVSNWVTGQSSSDFIEEQYDKFVDFVEYGFGNYLPWMLRSCDTLAQFGAEWAKNIEWKNAISALENARAVDRTIEDEQTSNVPHL